MTATMATVDPETPLNPSKTTNSAMYQRTMVRAMVASRWKTYYSGFILVLLPGMSVMDDMSNPEGTVGKCCGKSAVFHRTIHDAGIPKTVDDASRANLKSD
jgi:hypothetical protein